MAISLYYANQLILGGTEGYITGFIPHDFNSLKKCTLLFNPEDTNPALALTINISAGAVGELCTIKNSVLNDVAISVVQHQVFEVDITAFIAALVPSNIEANDYFGVQITNLGTDIYSMGMNLVYKSSNVQNGIVHEIEKFYHAPELIEGGN